MKLTSYDNYIPLYHTLNNPLKMSPKIMPLKMFTSKDQALKLYALLYVNILIKKKKQCTVFFFLIKFAKSEMEGGDALAFNIHTFHVILSPLPCNDL